MDDPCDFWVDVGAGVVHMCKSVCMYKEQGRQFLELALRGSNGNDILTTSVFWTWHMNELANIIPCPHYCTVPLEFLVTVSESLQQGWPGH